jgi:DNA-binding transcriptional ArsR family regulator
VRMFKALADPTRLRIVRLLHAQPHCTQQLAPALGISEAAVSKQLKLLTEAGCITAERSGSFVFYSLRMDETEMLMVYLRQFLEQ